MKVNLGKDTSGRPLVLDDSWIAKWRVAELRLGITLTVIQGSYRAGSALNRSAGTHDNGGAGDFRTRDIPASVGVDRAVRVLRECGFVCWARHASQGFPDQEIHALDYGNPDLSPAAKAQVVMWEHGRNGLIGTHAGPDDGPRVKIPKKAPPMPHLFIDYSMARPSPGAIKAERYRGVGRYLSDSAKGLTRGEADALLAEGLWILPIRESTAKRAADGRAAGVEDVRTAEGIAARLGIPKSVAIFYAVDFDADPARVKPYFQGVKATASHPVGVYGSARVVEAMIDSGLARWAWQTEAWSHGVVSPKAHLLQRAPDKHSTTIKGVGFGDWDENVVRHGVVPVWHASGKPAPKPLPKPEPKPAPAPKPGVHGFHWDAPMPASPLVQRHESPSQGDNVGAIERARGKVLDLNLTRAAGRNWAMHYPTPGPNGYTQVVDEATGEIRAMTILERRRPADKWGDAGIRRWRRPNGERPLTENAAVKHCAELGTLAIRELKSSAFATDPAAAAESLRVSKRYDHPAWFKTLFNLDNPRGKVVQYQAHGMHVALIFGRFVSGRLARLAASRRIVAKWGKTRPDATW